MHLLPFQGFLIFPGKNQTLLMLHSHSMKCIWIKIGRTKGRSFMTISLCMIVKNEETTLARCLNSVVGIADEIIIVDTGSTDRTKEIAGRYTDKIFDFPWVDDFAAARNFSFSKATMEYCMWLDAGDILLSADQTNLKKLKMELPVETDVVMMRYHTAFDEAGNPTFSYYRERIVRNHAGFFWQGAVHEVITPAGTIVSSEIAVTRRKLRPSDPDRDLRIFEKLLRDGRPLTPHEQFYYAQELYYHRRFQEADEAFTTFLDDGHGWIGNQIDACRLRADCRYQQGHAQQALESLLQRFAFDLPRAPVCCDIGKHFFDRRNYRVACFWYEQAIRCPRDERAGALIQPDYHGYIPYLQLCACCQRMGEREKAIAYNEKAGECKPNSAAVRQNREYFLQTSPGSGI